MCLQTGSNSPLKLAIQKCALNPYVDLVRSNRNYRLYLMSHMCQHIGDWFVRIAALVSVGRLTQGSSTALSILIMCRTMPEVLITPIGGVLADRFDRRKMMLRLDTIAAVSVLSYILAVRSGKVSFLFLVTVGRSFIQALYDPVTKSIVPMLVNDPESLKRAATLNGMMWSGMLVIGGVVSGYASALIGVEACYVLDSVTYFISAMIMSRVDGEYIANDFGDNQREEKYKSSPAMNKDNKNNNTGEGVAFDKKTILTPLRSFYLMNRELVYFLLSCGFGPLIFMKASGTFIFGAADILNVSFTHIEGDEAESSRRLGTLYSCIGIGCIIGPCVANSTFVNGNKPKTMQFACILAMAFMSFGWFGVANATTFKEICFYTGCRTIGSALVWLNSTLLLQTLTSNEMLGRVLGLEYSIARCCEAAAALIAGRLEDSGHGKHEIASLSAVFGATLLAFWSCFHLSGKGAANKELVPLKNKDEKTLPLLSA